MTFPRASERTQVLPLRLRDLSGLTPSRLHHHSIRGGITFPWELFLTARALHPDKTLILSGGLTPANVAEAVRLTRPAAVDVASGVERTPGIKDLEQVAAFIQATRAAST